MICPKCASTHTNVFDSRQYEKRRRRRYHCMACGTRFTTTETIVEKCKFCEEKVSEPKPIHAECWERECHNVAETFCDHYCRFPAECKTQDNLDSHCDRCVLINLLNLGT